VIHGAEDRLIPPGNGRDVAKRIPGARFVELEDASHIFWTDRQADTIRLLTDWLAEQSAR
ncbi:MAG TPA: alpha/beta hydrolase, partial [Actinomycetota bacterium]|nr:alpha/beta hydrolase [Actinomycetota bacterium]